MVEGPRRLLARLLKVPGEPDPPLGEPASVRIFRAAPGFLSYRILSWSLKQLGALAGLLAGFALLTGFELGLDALEKPAELLERWSAWKWLGMVERLALAAFALQLVPSLLLVLLDYHYRWYVTTDRSLRIREGIWRVRERTMTYSNIQNVEIRQGPLQRAFGIADLRVQTAGGGGKEGEGDDQSSAEDLHVGVFRGVGNAEEIRAAVLAALRRLRDSGLGDPDEPRPEHTLDHETPPSAGDQAEHAGAAPPALDAAHEVLRETRRLSAALRQA